MIFPPINTTAELRKIRGDIERNYPRRTLWKSVAEGKIIRITGCTLEADTYVPRIQFVISGTPGPSFNLTIDRFNEEFISYVSVS